MEHSLTEALLRSFEVRKREKRERRKKTRIRGGRKIKATKARANARGKAVHPATAIWGPQKRKCVKGGGKNGKEAVAKKEGNGPSSISIAGDAMQETERLPARDQEAIDANSVPSRI